MADAFVNMLAFLGWNAGGEQEIFSIEELIEKFSIERVHKGGAKFDYEKAKWFNHQYIQHASDEKLLPLVKPYFEKKGIVATDAYMQQVIGLIKERCILLPDFIQQGHFFFTTPTDIDLPSIQAKWDEKKKQFFEAWIAVLGAITDWNHASLEHSFNEMMEQHGLKKGDVLLPLRIILVGGKYGPGVFIIAEMIGKGETVKRLQNALKAL